MDTHGSIGIRDPRLPPDLSTHPASPLRWRWEYLERQGGPLLRHGRFFCALEESTQPAAIMGHPRISASEAQARVAQLIELVGVLMGRLDARARGARPCLEPRSAHSKSVVAAVQTWSGIQLTLLQAHYGDSDRRLDLAALEEAFLYFASGRLRVPVVGVRGMGEPDSAYYFAFAEFALLAVELGIDADLWEAQLPHLIWTQAVYAHMQRPIGAGPHRFHDYRPRGKERVFDPALADLARASVASLRTRDELETAHTESCRRTFGDLQ